MPKIGMESFSKRFQVLVLFSREGSRGGGGAGKAALAAKAAATPLLPFSVSLRSNKGRGEGRERGKRRGRGKEGREEKE